MSKKYVIEIKPEYEDSFKGVMILGAKDNDLFVDALAVDDLEELDYDHINEKLDWIQNKAYQRGLDDAWEAARKIVGYTDHGGLTVDALGEVFGTSSYSRIVRDNTAQEAIAKLKAYEEKQKADDEIKVGDVVKPRENVSYIKIPFVVTKVSDGRVWGVSTDGSWNYWAIDDVTKTDKHFDIDKILEEMKG